MMVAKGQNARGGTRGRPRKAQGPTQDAGGLGSQGESGASTATSFPTVGGTKKVKIEVVAVPGRGGRQLSEEAWPFGDLPPATRTEGGEIQGPSFFIPEAENPEAALASARKRHKGVSFISRKMEVDGTKGVRVWQAPIGE